MASSPNDAVVRVGARKPAQRERTARVSDDSGGEGVGTDGNKECLLVPVDVGEGDVADAVEPLLVVGRAGR